MVVETAAERGWLLRGPAKVRIAVEDEVKLGRFRLTGRIEVVEGDAGGDQHSHDRPAGATPQPRPAEPAPGRTTPPPADAPASGSGIDHTQVVTTAPPSGLHLVVHRAQAGAGTRVPITGPRLTAGRLDRCDLTIDDSTVSREHAAFVRRGDQWWVVDLGSTNGTKVNGRRAAEHPLEPGDRIELGDAVVQLVGG